MFVYGVAHDPDDTARWLDAPGRHLLVPGDAGYPAPLAAIPDPPPRLYVQGEVAALARAQLAVVGSRRPTAGGRQTAHAFAAALARAGLAVTSGLASGIDAAAHQGALDAGGSTIAVCGTGLDQVYPPGHRRLAAAIAAGGALVSEFPPGTPPRRQNFPRRNRIISGLGLGVLVIEAAQRSGSLITARLAAEQGRDVFAVPGSIHNPMARGCHRLIREGAILVEGPAEVLAALRLDTFLALPPGPAQAAAAQGISAGALDSECKILLNACGFEPVDVDVLVARTGLKASAISSLLLLLELKGEIESFAGGRYCRLPARPSG